MSSVLRASLYQLYANDYAVLDLLDQIEWSDLSRKFDDELYSRISREDAKLAQAMLVSDVLLRYDQAVAQAAVACTGKLAEIMSILIIEPQGKAN
jgi:hypothetical protein